MNGKGDRSRITNVKRYKDNYDRIFNSKSDIEPRTGKLRPDVGQYKMGRDTGSNSKGIQDREGNPDSRS